jgi:hypothetical protein
MYYGLFFDKNKFKPKLEKIIEKPHVTFLYDNKLELPLELINKKANVKVVGYGNDGKNEGYLVELINDEFLDFYKGAKQMHITISLSNDAKAVNTCDLIFKPIESFELCGIFNIEK